MQRARSLLSLPALHFKVRASPVYFGAHAVATGVVFVVLVWASFSALKVETIGGARQIYHWDGLLAHLFGIKITSPRSLRATSLMYLLLFVTNVLAEFPQTTTLQQRRVALLFNVVVEVWLFIEAFYFHSVSGGFMFAVLAFLFLFAFVTVERSYDAVVAESASTAPATQPHRD